MSLGLWHSAQLLYRIEATSLLNVTSFLPDTLALVAAEKTKHSAASDTATADNKIAFFINPPLDPKDPAPFAVLLQKTTFAAANLTKQRA
jgi:hypothetical protein